MLCHFLKVFSFSKQLNFIFHPELPSTIRARGHNGVSANGPQSGPLCAHKSNKTALRTPQKSFCLHTAPLCTHYCTLHTQYMLSNLTLPDLLYSLIRRRKKYNHLRPILIILYPYHKIYSNLKILFQTKNAFFLLYILYRKSKFKRNVLTKLK